MNAPSFAPILDRKPGDIERPKQLPPGSYVFVIKGVPRYDVSTQRKTPFAEFTVVPQGPATNPAGENLDVVQEDLDAVLSRNNGEKAAIQSKAQRLTFYLTEAALYRVEDFLRDCGFDIPTDEEKKELSEEDLDAYPTLRQMMGEVNNLRFGGFISHKPSDDGTTMYANITKTFRLDE